MCYTFGARGWLKGVVRGRNKRFQSSTEQADFGVLRTEIQDLPRGKIRLFGCRWCDGAERISEEILGAQQHHRGSQRYIIPRPAAIRHLSSHSKSAIQNKMPSMRKQYHTFRKNQRPSIDYRPLSWYNACNYPWKGAFYVAGQLEKTPCCTALFDFAGIGQQNAAFSCNFYTRTFA